MSPLKRARLQRNWSGAYLGAIAGMSDASIYRIECGKQKPKPGNAERIAAAFGEELTEEQILYPSRFPCCEVLQKRAGRKGNKLSQSFCKVKDD